jgi:hypothetical protein
MWPSAKRSYAPVVLGNTPNPIHYREDGPTVRRDHSVMPLGGAARAP